MAASSCVKCGNHTFELKVGTPRSTRFKYNYIQCVGCGGVVGVTDYYNNAVQLEEVKELLKKLARHTGMYIPS